MPTTRLTLGAAAALLVGAVWWLTRGDDPAPVQAAPPPAAASSAPEGRSTDVPSVGEPEAPDRTALPSAVADDGALAHPYGYELEVQVLDDLGLPVRGARVLLAPPGCRLGEVAERTGDDGVTRVAWSGRTAAMPMVVATTSDVTREAMRVVTVESGRPAHVVFGGHARRGAVLRLVGDGRQGSQVFAVTLQDLEPALGQALALSVEGIVRQRGLFSDNPDVRDGLHPFARFGDVLWPERADDASVQAVRSVGTFNLQFAAVDVQIAGSSDGSKASVEGTVYGEDGRPCAGCPVSWGRAVDRPRGSTKTDAQGAFRFENLPEGALELRAGGGDDGLGRSTVHTLAGQTTSADVQLRREATVRGRALAADGAPLSGWRVEWVGAAEPWFDACTVGDDGAFVLPNLPGGAGDLLLWRTERSRLPALRVENVRPDTGAVELRVDRAECVGVLQIEPLLPDGVDEAGVEVRIVQEATGRGTTLTKDEKTNRFAIGELPAGWYRIELGGPGLGWLDAGRHFVDGKGVFDLGRVAFAATGTLRLELPEGVEVKAPGEEGGFALEVYRLRDDCDVRTEHVTEASGGTLPLPPGDYVVLWRAPSGATGIERLTAQSGREVSVRCGIAARAGQGPPGGAERR